MLSRQYLVFSQLQKLSMSYPSTIVWRLLYGIVLSEIDSINRSMISMKIRTEQGIRQSKKGSFGLVEFKSVAQHLLCNR